MAELFLAVGCWPQVTSHSGGFLPRFFSCWVNKPELRGQDWDKPRTQAFGGYPEGYPSARLGYESVKTDAVVRVAHSPPDRSWWDLLPCVWLGRTGPL